MIDYTLKIQKITNAEYQEMYIVLDSLNTPIGIAKDFKSAYLIMKMYKEYIFKTYKLKSDVTQIKTNPSQNEKLDVPDEYLIEELLVSVNILMKEEFTYTLNENVVSEISFKINPPRDRKMFSKNDMQTIHFEKIRILFENMSSHTPDMKKRILRLANEHHIPESLFSIDTIDKKPVKKTMND